LDFLASVCLRGIEASEIASLLFTARQSTVSGGKFRNPSAIHLTRNLKRTVRGRYHSKP
jgi:hypothetical protein